MKILVLHATGLHLGYLGCYGCDWVATPNLDRLAADAVVFDQHYADRPRLNLPASSRSCLTGRCVLPAPDGDMSSDAYPLLPEILNAAGIHSARVELENAAKDVVTTSCQALRRLAKAKDGLLWLEWPSLAPPWHIDTQFLESFFEESPGEDEEDIEPLEPWLDPPTGPIDSEGPALERLQTTYAAAVTVFDDQVGTILEKARETGLLDDLLVCVTASSGLALGEHGYFGEHRAWLHEEIVHVPLIMHLPDGREAGLRLSALTQPADLYATVLDAFGLPATAEHGRSLWPLIRGDVQQVREHACSGLQVGYSLEWSIRTREHALLLPLSTPPEDSPRPPQLYLKPEDRWEVNDVRQHQLEWADELEQVLRQSVVALQGLKS